jgi:hypothetical protein
VGWTGTGCAGNVENHNAVLCRAESRVRLSREGEAHHQGGGRGLLGIELSRCDENLVVVLQRYLIAVMAEQLTAEELLLAATPPTRTILPSGCDC